MENVLKGELRAEPEKMLARELADRDGQYYGKQSWEASPNLEEYYKEAEELADKIFLLIYPLWFYLEIC